MLREKGKASPARPADVATQLARRFAWKESTEQFFTLFYAVLNLRTRELTYISAGHPGAIWLSDGADARVLPGSGLPIGVGETYEQDAVQLKAGDRLYLYSDGVMEAMTAHCEQFGIERIAASLTASSTAELGRSIAMLLKDVEAWCGALRTQDDVSLIGLEVDGPTDR